MSRNLPLLKLLLYAMDGVSLICFWEYFIKIKVAQYKFHLTTTVAKVSLVHNMAHFLSLYSKKYQHSWKVCIAYFYVVEMGYDRFGDFFWLWMVNHNLRIHSSPLWVELTITKCSVCYEQWDECYQYINGHECQ